MKRHCFELFQNQLSDYYGLRNAFLFAKGRVGLYTVLKALSLQEGDEVLLPGYSCLVVPTAAKIQGIHPVYVDIDPASYNLNPDLLDASCTPRTKAVMVQHTYGIPCDMQPILDWAESKNLPVIEDCCLAFGSAYQGRLCGTFGRASYFSGQWNKPFSTGLGGMLLVSEQELAERVQHVVDRELQHPSMLYRFLIWFQIQLHENLVTPSTFQWIMHLYRFVSKAGFAVGSSTAGEYHGQVPKRYCLRMTAAQAQKGIDEMNRIEENLAHRKSIAALYEQELPGLGFAPVSLNYDAEPVYVRYPLRVRNKIDVLEAAFQEHIEIGSWFESPLHPKGTNLAALDYIVGSCPEAERASQETINLPTHRKITNSDAERVLTFLKKYAYPVE